MDNKGRVTVFLCLITGAFIILALNVIRIIDIHTARAKAAICFNTAMSSVKALYNDYIFEHYHILLFDKNCGGRGEAFLEKEIKALLEENLGIKYDVLDVRGTDYDLIIEDGYAGLKKQISDYMLYAGIEYGFEQISEMTGGSDGSISDDVLEEMDNAYDTESTEEAEDNSDGYELGDGESVSDPREYVSDVLGGALLYIVLPEGEVPSNTHHQIYNTPSFYCKTEEEDISDRGINLKFDDMDSLKSDITHHGSWMDSVCDTGAVVFYARNVFNCATNAEVNEGTVFEYELEYLVGGRSSDSGNLYKTVNEIIALRMPVNFAYVLSDVKRVSQIKAISWPICLVSHIPERVIRYLIAGCWSYVEAVAEVRHLLKGERLAFFKNNENWITDIEDIAGSVSGQAKLEDRGLSYEDYLMILLALNIDRTCVRMLDLMEMNAQQEDESFQMESSATGFSMDFIVKYGEYDCSLGMSAEY